MAECTCKTGCSDCLVKTYKKRRDTAEIVERTLNVSWTGGSHHNRVISANFPECFTRAECNYYLQRFMTPTKEAFQGLGNGYADGGRQPLPGVMEDWSKIPGQPESKATVSGWREIGWVAMWPLDVDFEIPDTDHLTRIGLVTITRTDGKLVNTTQYPHPFIGTITVTLEGGPGAFYVQVVGASTEGQTPAGQSSDAKPINNELARAVPGVSIWNGFAWVSQMVHPIDNTRNALNTWLGPVLFMNLSNIMIYHAFTEKRQLCGGVPVAYGSPKMPSTSSFKAMAEALQGAAQSIGSDAASGAKSIWSEIFGSKPAY